MRCVATILVMENDEAVAELLAEVVRRLGHTPHDPRETWQLPESFAAVVLEPGDAGTLGWARQRNRSSRLRPHWPKQSRSSSGRTSASASRSVRAQPAPWPRRARTCASRGPASRARVTL